MSLTLGSTFAPQSTCSEKKKMSTGTTPSALNPKLLRIIWTRSTPRGYQVLSLQENHDAEEALARADGTVVIGGQAHTLDMSAPTRYAKFQQNSSRTLSRYLCTYYFMTSSVKWSPCHHTVCEKLEESVDTGTLTYFDGERDFNVTELYQMNRESKRQRPLIHLRSDGTAVRGDIMGTWGCLDGHVFTAVDYDTCEVLERAWRGGSKTATLRGQLATISPDGSGFLGGRPLVRYQCTWHFLNDDGTLESMDPNTDRVLDMAFKAGHEELIDGVRVYDFVKMTQLNKETSRERPIMCLLPIKGVVRGPEAVQTKLSTDHPDIDARLKEATLPRAAADLKAAITGADKTKMGLAIINICVNELDCRVKGGIIRDVVVRGDVMVNDVDLEGSRSLTKGNWRATLEGYVSVLTSKYGFTAPGQVSSRRSKDFLGTGSIVDDGMLTIQFPTMKVELEIVPPWNIMYYPPRNVDFSVNNLALSRFMGATFSQVVCCGLTTDDIVTQIVERKATPVYDIKWVPFTGQGQYGEGYFRDKWVETYCPTATGRGGGHSSSVPVAERLHMAEHRLKKMRDKGFWFVEAIIPAGYDPSKVPMPPPQAASAEWVGGGGGR